MFTLLIVFFILFLTMNFIMSIIDMIGASLYDVKSTLDYRKILHLKKRQHRNNTPRVSVIIPALNEAKTILQCIESITNSTYKNIEIILSDDGSTDRTKILVDNYRRRKHVVVPIKIVGDGTNRGRGGALNIGLKKSTGSLILALDADCTITAKTIETAVDHFRYNRRLAALASNVKIQPSLSLIGLMQQFEWLSAWRSKKFNSFANAEYIIGGAGAVYKRSILDKIGGFDESMLTEDIDLSLRIAALGNKRYELRYASNVVVYTQHVPTYKSLFRQRLRWKLGMLQALFASRHLIFSRNSQKYTKSLTWVRLPLVIWSEITLLLEPLLLSYFVYVALAYQTPILFIVSWAALTITLLFTIWGDDILKPKEKIRFTLFMPVVYFLYYILSFIQILAMFKALKRHRVIRGISKTNGSWISPERVS